MAQQEHEIYGITYVTPHVPPKAQIYGSEFPTKKQKFQRVVIPESFSLLEYDEEGMADYSKTQLEFIEQQQYHMVHGCWFMNNGTPTYITGLHYFYLNFWVLDTDVYPDYRDADRKWFYFQDWCQKQKHVDGIIRVKKRREGATSQASCSLVYDAIMTTVAFCGIVSKEKDTAADVFNLMVAHGYRNLPEFLKVRCEDEESKTKLIFRQKAVKSKAAKADKKKGQVFSSSMGLGSRIDFKPTKPNSYDGSRLTKILIDECFAPKTKILCEGAVFRNIEDIKVGDKVIVEGGKLVEVGKTCHGYDDMYLIKQPYSKDYVVNSKHRLYLEQRCSVSSIKDDGIKIYTPEQFLNLGKYRKRTTYGVRSAGIDFEHKEVPFDPYLFGVWIGDGCNDGARFTVNAEDDPEMVKHIENFAKEKGFRVYKSERFGPNKKALAISLSDGNNRWKPNTLREALKQMGVFKNKHIPSLYLHNSRDVRLKILAGILDTDGHSPKPGVIDIAMSKEHIIKDIVFLARSLGFSVSKIKYCISNFNTNAYKISISGNLSELPLIIKRKAQNGYVQKYKYRRNRIEVEKIGYGEYYGITLKADNDDDRRLILEDFTISMNCAKWPPDCPIDEYWPVVQKTMKQGVIKVGFALMPSTTNRGENGGSGFRRLWDDSNQLLGQRTGTGLYRYFLTASEGYEGYIDEYGMSVVEKPTPEQAAWMRKKYGFGDFECSMGAREMILYKRSLIRNPAALKKEVLDFPLTEKEAFDFSEDSNIYNTSYLNEQREYLHERNLKFRTVRFFEREGEVDFVDDPNGLWKILYLPKDEDKNRHVYKGNMRVPGNKAKYVLSVDPYKSTVKIGPGSMGCGMIWTKFDPLDPENTGMPIGLYYGRPRLKALFHEQMLLAARYYGCELCYESDIDDYIEYVESVGYRGYVMEKPKNSIDPNRRKRIEKARQFGIKAADGFALSAMITSSVEYVELHSEKIYFMEIIEDLLDYEPDNRTEHDIAAAFQVGCLAIQNPIKAKKEDAKKIVALRTFDLTQQAW